MDKITHDLDMNIYHHINDFKREYTRAINNQLAIVNRITLLWIITLIVWWFK